MIAGGIHAEIGTKYFRVGHMHISSMNASLAHIDSVIKAVGLALEETGFDSKAAMQGIGSNWKPRLNKAVASHDEL